MSKITKVFDLKTRIKIKLELSDAGIERTIKRLSDDMHSEDKAKACQSRYLLAAAYAGGVDGLVDAVVTQAFRESFRKGEIDFGFDGDDITVSPPQLVFKR